MGGTAVIMEKLFPFNYKNKRGNKFFRSLQTRSVKCEEKI